MPESHPARFPRRLAAAITHQFRLTSDASQNRILVHNPLQRFSSEPVDASKYKEKGGTHAEPVVMEGPPAAHPLRNAREHIDNALYLPVASPFMKLPSKSDLPKSLFPPP